MQEPYHIRFAPPEPIRFAFLPGDPGRVPLIASYLDRPVLAAQNREFTTYTGFLNSVPVCVTSTGIGGPSAAIAMEELISLGVDTFIRIGTCGGMRTDLAPNTLVIPTGAIRSEGTSREYLPVEFPAVPDFDMLAALVSSAKELGYAYRAGVVHCKDSFYGQHAPESMPVADLLSYQWEAYRRGGALASEMESAALYTVAAARGVRCATVLQTIWNQEQGEAGQREDAHDDMTRAIETALGAMRKLASCEG